VKAQKQINKKIVYLTFHIVFYSILF